MFWCICFPDFISCLCCVRFFFFFYRKCVPIGLLRPHWAPYPMPVNSSNVDIHDPVASDSIHASQDVTNQSFTALASVVVRSKDTPDKAPFVSYTGDLGTTLGGLAAAGVPSGDSSFTRMSFSDLETRIRFFESLGIGIPDSFLD